MKTISRKPLAKATFALVLFIALPLVAQERFINHAPIPLISFSNVPVTIAIANLSCNAGINYSLDPKLFSLVDGSTKPEPVLTIKWENISVESALARVLKEHDLIMTTNSFTTVVRITGTNYVARPIDVTLIGADTNGTIPLLSFMDVPLNEALTMLVDQAHIKAVLDPHVSGDALPEPPDFKMTMMPTVSFRWEHLTARQALVEICELYDLLIIKGSKPDTVLIKPRKQSAQR